MVYRIKPSYIRLYLYILYFQFIVIMSAIGYSPAYYGDYVFPDWAQALGWMMVVAPLVTVIGVMIVQVIIKGVSL